MLLKFLILFLAQRLVSCGWDNYRNGFSWVNISVNTDPNANRHLFTDFNSIDIHKINKEFYDTYLRNERIRQSTYDNYVYPKTKYVQVKKFGCTGVNDDTLSILAAHDPRFASSLIVQSVAAALIKLNAKDTNVLSKLKYYCGEGSSNQVRGFHDALSVIFDKKNKIARINNYAMANFKIGVSEGILDAIYGIPQIRYDFNNYFNAFTLSTVFVLLGYSTTSQVLGVMGYHTNSDNQLELVQKFTPGISNTGQLFILQGHQVTADTNGYLRSMISKEKLLNAITFSSWEKISIPQKPTFSKVLPAENLLLVGTTTGAEEVFVRGIVGSYFNESWNFNYLFNRHSLKSLLQQYTEDFTICTVRPNPINMKDVSKMIFERYQKFAWRFQWLSMHSQEKDKELLNLANINNFFYDDFYFVSEFSQSMLLQKAKEELNKIGINLKDINHIKNMNEASLEKILYIGKVQPYEIKYCVRFEVFETEWEGDSYWMKGHDIENTAFIPDPSKLEDLEKIVFEEYDKEFRRKVNSIPDKEIYDLIDFTTPETKAKELENIKETFLDLLPLTIFQNKEIQCGYKKYPKEIYIDDLYEFVDYSLCLFTATAPNPPKEIPPVGYNEGFFTAINDIFLFSERENMIFESYNPLFSEYKMIPYGQTEYTILFVKEKLECSELQNKPLDLLQATTISFRWALTGFSEAFKVMKISIQYPWGWYESFIPVPIMNSRPIFYQEIKSDSDKDKNKVYKFKLVDMEEYVDEYIFNLRKKFGIHFSFQIDFRIISSYATGINYAYDSSKFSLSPDFVKKLFRLLDLKKTYGFDDYNTKKIIKCDANKQDQLTLFGGFNMINVIADYFEMKTALKESLHLVFYEYNITLDELEGQSGISLLSEFENFYKTFQESNLHTIIKKFFSYENIMFNNKIYFVIDIEDRITWLKKVYQLNDQQISLIDQMVSWIREKLIFELYASSVKYHYLYTNKTRMIQEKLIIAEFNIFSTDQGLQVAKVEITNETQLDKNDYHDNCLRLYKFIAEKENNDEWDLLEYYAPYAYISIQEYYPKCPKFLEGKDLVNIETDELNFRIRYTNNLFCFYTNPLITKFSSSMKRLKSKVTHILSQIKNLNFVWKFNFLKDGQDDTFLTTVISEDIKEECVGDVWNSMLAYSKANNRTCNEEEIYTTITPTELPVITEDLGIKIGFCITLLTTVILFMMLINIKYKNYRRRKINKHQQQDIKDPVEMESFVEYN